MTKQTKSLIESYSDKSPSALKESKVYKLVEKTINSTFKKICFNIKEKTFTEFRLLLGENLTRETASRILQPWTNAIRIADLIEKANLTANKAKYHQYSRYLDNMVKNLQRGITPEEQLIFFLTGYELNHELMIEHFNAIKLHFSPILELKIPNGAIFNPYNIRKRGIFSLFHLGERLGLEKIGKPFSLHHFIHIATGMEYKIIDDYSSQYDKEKFETTSSNHRVYNFIYDPEKPIDY
jgi:hypothetical protein